MFEEAAMPEGLVVPLEGGRREAVQLMGDERVGAVTLTGSCAAGYSAQEICARRRIPLQAELGGNNAAIVWPDADLTAAAQRVAAGAFEMAGQRCTANRRVIVHEGCRDEFVERLRTQAAALSWGDPLDAETDIGPLVNERHRDRVARQVDRALAACGPALLPHGAVSPAGEGCWYPPTVLPCEDPALEIVQEETFGPVLVVQTARDWAQAIDLCNRVRQGLAAAIFTRSPEIQRRFLEEANAGILKVNQSTADAAVGVPFGGWKASGLGPPEHGVGDAEFFSRSQTVYGDLGSPAE
jgi:acyl-CoA reductase-like NAD-dependent aldehyde dehydrogenase